MTRLRRAPTRQPGPPGLDTCRSLLVYAGPSRRLVTGLKYRNQRAALGWLAGRMAPLLDPPPGAVVTWAPTSRRRRRSRGFDQAELLARAVARRWRVPCRRLLVRRPGRADRAERADRAQTGASVAERRAGPAFAAVRPVRAPVVVVDDVTTTGATLASAARALRSAGAPWVAGLTVARTPRLQRESVSALSHPSPDVNKTLKFAGRSTEYGQ